MAMEVAEVGGFYIASSLPKVLYIPDPCTSRRNKDNVHVSDVLYFKPRKQSQEKAKHASGSGSAPKPGYSDMMLQTDLYLEELCDVVEEANAQCETDPFLDRPPSPLFIPTKTGVDVATQIYPGELFDFDEEVEPILEALVGGTLQQALVEISDEDELVNPAERQSSGKEKENVGVGAGERLGEQDRHIFEEKDQEEAVQLEEEIAQKVRACVYSQNYLNDLVPQVYKKLETEGYFDSDDPETAEIEESFWPWLMNEVDSEIATLEASCQLLDSLIENSLQNNVETSVIKPITNHDSATNDNHQTSAEFNDTHALQEDGSIYSKEDADKDIQDIFNDPLDEEQTSSGEDTANTL